MGRLLAQAAQVREELRQAQRAVASLMWGLPKQKQGAAVWRNAPQILINHTKLL
jgi:hypothetical protein